MASDRPFILLSNDDGIHSEGIGALAEALSAVGAVAVVAPDREQSAASHKLSLHTPLRAHQVREGWWAVTGTPADCVYLALLALLDRRPDLVVSGINSGPNLGTDVHYSGTVAAAMEGTLLGVPGIAVSAVSRSEPDYAHGAQFTRRLVERVLAQQGLPKGVTLNVNVPRGKPTRYQKTFLGHRLYDHGVHTRTDPRGRPYYWIGGNPVPHDDEPGSDSAAVRSGVISVTALGLDITDVRHHRAMDLALEGYDSVDAVGPSDSFRLGEAY